MPNREESKLNTENPILVLNDGETFTSLAGCMIAFMPPEMHETDQIEETLREDTQDTFTFGSEQSHWENKDIAEILKVMFPSQDVRYDKYTNIIKINP